MLQRNVLTEVFAERNMMPITIGAKKCASHDIDQPLILRCNNF